MQTLLEYIKKKSTSDYSGKIYVGMTCDDFSNIVLPALGLKGYIHLDRDNIDNFLEQYTGINIAGSMYYKAIQKRIIYLQLRTGELFTLGFPTGTLRLETAVYTDKNGRPNSSTDIAIERLNKILEKYL